jgi:hypothetical protein
MGIRVQRGLKRLLRSVETVIFLVRSQEEDRLGPAMEAACADIRAMDAGWDSVPGLQPGQSNNPAYVSDPIAVPGGRLVMVDFDFVPVAMRERLPDIVAAQLERAGIRDATIGPAPEIGDRYESLRRFVPIARA